MDGNPPSYVIELARAEAELQGLLAALAFWNLQRIAGGADDEIFSRAFTHILVERHRIKADLERALTRIRQN